MSDTINQNFTILIPTLNEEKNIKRLIDTILSLYPSINITVIDDGSTDDTVKLVNEFNDVVSLINRIELKRKFGLLFFKKVLGKIIPKSVKDLIKNILIKKY